MDPARRESEAPLLTAPDGSAVRPLALTSRGSMATFRLAPGQVAAAVVHRTVDELWFVVEGSGWLWRREGADGAVPGNAEGDLSRLEPGVAVDLPAGTAFQFRASVDAELVVVGVTMPPWPGDGEAVPVPGGPWPASTTDD
jgi:mannose-6-phosphate isomerase-like protein (cupin superfamily)